MAMFGDKLGLGGSKQMQQDGPQRPVMREPYQGRYRINPDRSVDQWDGTGYSPRSSATIAPEAATRLNSASSELDRLTAASLQGQQFLQLNSSEPTGSAALRFPLTRDLATTGNSRLQQMENIQNSRVFEYMRGGAEGGGISATAANTPGEQMRLERTGPTISNDGPANRAIMLQIQIDRDLQDARLAAMEEWARDPRRRSLDGFSRWWGREAGPMRARIQRGYEATNGAVDNQANWRGEQRPNPRADGSRWQAEGRDDKRLGPSTPPPRPSTVPPDAQWNPATRRWTRG
jgi:hypothetical protein